MRPVSTIPWKKYRGFAEKLTRQLSGDYSGNRMDVLEHINRQLAGWANFYQYTDFTATVFRKIDRIVFWKLGHWIARKYRKGFRLLMRHYVRSPEAGHAKTWVLRGRNSKGMYVEIALRRLVTSRKGRFRYRTPDGNPYLMQDENRTTIESRYGDLAFALSST